ncbi:MAG: phytanoyl-CoA dioxygenase family protein, partial [Candidatus Dormibacteria bacterium]
PEVVKEKFQTVPVEMVKGEGSFHHARTMHGSGTNDTSKMRRATVINVFRDGVISNSDDPLLQNIPTIPRGEKIGGRFFPLLIDPTSLAAGNR